MWVLECDGDLFGGKGKWLKPGQKYLFGRTRGDEKPGEQFHVIDNKSVSRKHLIIAVASVAQGQGKHLYQKSQLTVTDESKLGTQVDGEKLLKETRTLSEKSHSIKLGSYVQVFRITWRPVVFTFSYTLKEQQKIGDILAPFRKVLEPFDIKAILGYSTIETTHVVASKRNIPKSLQALINGKHIVKESFVDALVIACTAVGPTDDGATPLPSPLEEDFESAWPDALSFLPDPGKEPVVRPPECFAPNPERISLFEGYSFIFADDVQYDQLSPIVMNGGAKAFKYELKLGETKLEDFVQFVRELENPKGVRNSAPADSDRKVVVVRFRGKGGTEQWALDFVQGLDSQLGQRSIEQNEFLDAILMNDVGPLYRALEEEDPESFQTVQPTAVDELRGGSRATNGRRRDTTQHEVAEVEADNAMPPSPKAEVMESPRKTRIRRPITESRLKGFDDFDPSELPKNRKGAADRIDDQDEDEGAQEDDQLRGHQSEMEVDSQSLFVSQSQPGTRSRKRPLEDEDPGASMYDELLPATAAMKRRRLEQERSGEVTPLAEVEHDEPLPSKQPTKKQAVKKKKEIDIRTEARVHAEKLDKERRSESRSRDDANGIDHDEDVSKLRDLVLIEDMPVPPRSRPIAANTRSSMDGSDSRWDDRWNGLKNFKKFRRQGQRDAPAANRGRRILVGLEEVKRKDFGIGENYWLEPASSSRRNRQARSQGQNQTQSQTQRASDARVEPDENEDEDLLPEEVAGRPREGPIADALAERTQTNSGTTTRGKRAAASAGKSQPPSKRTRQTRATQQAKDEESSDEDELKFRFKKR